MAKIFLVKDGSGDSHTSQAHHIRMSDVLNVTQGFDLKYFEKGPTLNPEISASPFSQYRYIVVEVEEGELSTRFPEIGFYLVLDLDVKQAQTSLGIVNPEYD